MTVIALTSVRSSPGATSLGVALSAAWASASDDLALLIEADPAGGVLGLRFELPSEPSLATLSADLRRHGNRSLVLSNSVELAGARCVTAPADPFIASGVLNRSAKTLSDQLASLGLATAIDLGRIERRSPAMPLAVGADQVLVVCRPRADEVQSALFTVRLLRSAGCNVGLVTIGDRPHHPREVADLAGVPLVAVLPDDPAMAVAFGGGRYVSRKLRRSTLWRAVLSLSDSLLDAYPPAMAEGPPAAIQGEPLPPDRWPPPETSALRTPAVTTNTTAAVTVPLPPSHPTPLPQTIPLPHTTPLPQTSCDEVSPGGEPFEGIFLADHPVFENSEPTR